MKTTRSILTSVDDTLRTVRLGLHDFLDGPSPRKTIGLLNLVTFGRAVTNVLQNLRATEGDFDEWYAPYQDEMRNDETMKYFYNLRSTILKEGLAAKNPSIEIASFQLKPGDLPAPPEGTVRTIVGDFSDGGSSYHVVAREDGGEDRFYFEPPKGMLEEVKYLFADSPRHHLGGDVSSLSAEELAQLFVQYLEKLVASAKTRFLGTS